MVTIIGNSKELKISGIKRNFVLCLCNRCNNEFYARKDHVLRKKNPIKSCGCCQHESTGRIAHNAKPEGIAAARSVFNGYKNKCKKKNIMFDLSFEYFLNLSKQQCFYCGAEPSQSYSGVFKHGIRAGKKKVNGTFVYNGLDRIEPKRGYAPENVRPCCRFCNTAKLDRPEQEFQDWLDRAATYRGWKK
jgi:hypothetical protein